MDIEKNNKSSFLSEHNFDSELDSNSSDLELADNPMSYYN
jgi:hypothetical protein